MRRGSLSTPPASASRPRRASGKPKRALEDRHDQVAAQRQFETAADGITVDRGDDRLVAAVEDVGWEVDRVAQLIVVCLFDAVFQVRAGREGALTGAGENGDPDLVVGDEVVPGPGQLGVGWGMQGVHHLRAIHRHIGDAALFFVEDMFEWWWGHVFSLLDVLSQPCERGSSGRWLRCLDVPDSFPSDPCGAIRAASCES